MSERHSMKIVHEIINNVNGSRIIVASADDGDGFTIEDRDADNDLRSNVHLNFDEATLVIKALQEQIAQRAK